MKNDLANVTVNRSLIRQAVLHKAAFHPVSMACAGLGVTTLAGGLLLGGSWIVLATGALVLPAGFVAMTKFRAPYFSQQFMRDVADALYRKRQRRLGEIRADLFNLANDLPASDAVGDLAADALGQFGIIHEKLDHLLSVLDRKLVPGELTHARYLSAADQYFMKVTEHLGTIVDMLNVAANATNDMQRQQQLERINLLLQQNTDALVAFDQSASALAALPDLEASGSPDLDIVTQQLETLAEQTRRIGAAAADE